MQPPKPPQIAAVDVVPAQADSMALTHLSVHADASVPQVAHVVKVKLKSRLPATSLGWALYVGDVRIPKYWEYEDGIFFTVVDPDFFAEHKGERLRFSHDGAEFHDTGVKLPGVPASARPVAAVSEALSATTQPSRRRTTAKKAKAKTKRKRAKRR